jgi:hypothetical protein
MSMISVADGRLFLGGIVVGLTLSTVAVLTVGAARRARRRRSERIPAAEARLSAEEVRPTAESNAFPNHLESERFDPPPLSQRW